jgi:DMSO/TMAO reductase YedYZ molybdopterin-dependent catalytic subunit
MTIGAPTAVVMDGRDALLAVGMNGVPLPVSHGFPVRTVVPGLYGYVSATKWLVDLEATTYGAYSPYWVRRGWAQRAPVLLESRIDSPLPFARPRVGERTAIAGVAWYQHVGVERVEVQVGEGPWTQARLGRVPSTDTWVQWLLPWTPQRRGPVTLRVRATGRDGKLQPPERQPPFPSGATGWHTIVVTATG